MTRWLCLDGPLNGLYVTRDEGRALGYRQIPGGAREAWWPERVLTHPWAD